MKPETAVVEAEVESFSPVPVNEDKIAAVISMAERLEPLGQALDKFQAFVLKRAMPGDWVSFKERDGAGETLELTGAATDRIAAALGISFVDWKDYKVADSDDKGPYYDWFYECTTLWQGRRIERATGRAGTRDKFFGFAHGQAKALADIKEGDIRTAARRNAMKEGVKLMLGLRRIPKETAAKMGLDLSKVKSVEFSKKEKAPVKGAATTVSKVEPRKMRKKSDGSEFTKWVVTFSSGATASTLNKELADSCQIAMENGEKVIPECKETQYGADLMAINTAQEGQEGA